jgi:hypothetical protein
LFFHPAFGSLPPFRFLFPACVPPALRSGTPWPLAVL